VGGDSEASEQNSFMTHGSAIECTGCLDASVAKEFVSLERVAIRLVFAPLGSAKPWKWL
jgi:hypothetical protein